MADEEVTKASAGPAKRQSRARRGPAAAPLGAAERPNLDEREKKISSRRKPMGPEAPPRGARAGFAAEAESSPSDEAPTDPE